jgi:hypothetical protein
MLFPFCMPFFKIHDMLLLTAFVHIIYTIDPQILATWLTEFWMVVRNIFQYNYCTCFLLPTKLCISSHTWTRKHQITAKFAGHWTCFMSPLLFTVQDIFVVTVKYALLSLCYMLIWLICAWQKMNYCCLSVSLFVAVRILKNLNTLCCVELGP